MVAAEGYVMTRAKGCFPHVVSEAEWRAAPLCDHKGDILPARNAK